MSASGKLELEILRAEVIGLNRALTWEQTQKERLLDELDRYQREIKRLHDRLTELELQIAERKHVFEQPLR
jgi:peptidoglycan hydrolase CwlO-like protein